MWIFLALQNRLTDWVRDHRVHHKYSETDADPHNSNRGFFFAHVGWLLQKKHPEVIKKGRTVDMSDVIEDPVVQFHNKWAADKISYFKSPFYLKEILYYFVLYFQILLVPPDFFLRRVTKLGAVLFLERRIIRQFLWSQYCQICVFAKLHVVGQFCSTYLGKQTVWQVSDNWIFSGISTTFSNFLLFKLV